MLGRCFAGSGLLTVVLLFGFCIFSMCSGWTLVNGAASLYLCIFYTSLITFLICGGLWLPKNCEHTAPFFNIVWHRHGSLFLFSRSAIAVLHLSYAVAPPGRKRRTHVSDRIDELL